MNEKTDPNAARKAWLGLLARCRAADLNALWTGAALNPDHTVLRSPEVGSVMVRGRAGAVGSAFNLGWRRGRTGMAMCRAATRSRRRRRR